MSAQPMGRIITFYSFKGGVGRSMALANAAVLLAQRGERVLALDMDWEAPGLHRYFLRSSAPAERYRPTAPQQGAIDFFTSLNSQLDASFPTEEEYCQDEAATSERITQIIRTLLDSGEYFYSVSILNPNRTAQPGPLALVLMTAGRFNEEYSDRVQGFDWKAFYRKYAEVFPLLREELKNRFDHVLIDSRTGVTDIGSICTSLLPDRLVLVFSPNNQSMEGALEIGRQAALARPGPLNLPPLPLFPLLSRLEQAEEGLKLRWIERARGEFEKLFREIYALETCDLSTYFDLVRIPHRSYYAYDEVIAAEHESVMESGGLAEVYSRFLDCLDRNKRGPTSSGLRMRPSTGERMPLRDDATRLFQFLYQYDEGDPATKGFHAFGGDELSEKLTMPIHRVEDAVKFLADRGWVDHADVLGGLMEVTLTTEGRAYIEERLASPNEDGTGELVIVYLGANPQETSMIALDEEAREIEAKIRASEHRSRVRFVSKWAVRPDDLLQALNEIKPHVVHFAGHGTKDGRLVLLGGSGEPKEVGAQALSFLFRTLKDNVRIVLLNACNSDALAQAVVQHVDCAIGVPAEIGDEAARIFAASFYRALGFGRTVRNAFEQGQVAMSLEGISEEQMPRLHVRAGVDPAVLHLL